MRSLIDRARSTCEWSLRLPLQIVPKTMVMPVLTGSARGSKWIVGAATHGCWLGTYESEKQQVIASLLNPGDCFLDIGANAGFYTLLAARLVGPTGRVIAFEPLPQNQQKLERHLALNQLTNVTVINAAVCDQDGRAAFQIGAADECGGLAITGTLEVDTVSLDGMWKASQLRSPRLIKIDVEGAEGRVLLGAEALIRATKPVILLAGHGTATQRACESILADFGYKVTIVRDGSVDGMYESTATPILNTPTVSVRSDSLQATDGGRAPRVSVVMSVYNDATRVRRALDGILEQSFRDFELIVVDDGSTDQTSIVLEQYRQRDPRVCVITQENTGLTRALIRGCDAARGEFIARHDSDDWSAPTRLAVQVGMLDSDPRIGFVSCATQFVGPHQEPLELVSQSFGPEVATERLLDHRLGPPAHGSVMFRRSLYEAVGGYRAEFYFGQDSDLWLRMAEQALIAYSTDVLYTACRDVNTISGRMGRVQHQYGDIGLACRAARRAGQSDSQILQDAARLTVQILSSRKQGSGSVGASAMAYLIGSSLSKRGHASARSYLWQAVRLNPLNWRAWGRLSASAFGVRHFRCEAARHE